MQNRNFLPRRDEPVFDDGRESTDQEIKKLHRRGSTSPDSLEKRTSETDNEADRRFASMSPKEQKAYMAPRSNAPVAAAVIKKLHSDGPQSPDLDELRKAAAVISGRKDATVQAIHKDHRKASERTVDWRALNAMLERGRLVRKLRKLRKSIALPPQDDDTSDGGAIADTGASNNWRDESAPSNTSTQLGPSHAASIREGRPPAQDSDVDPTVAALKRIFAAGPRRGL